MADTVLQMISDIVTAVGNWFGVFLDRTGLGGTYLSILMISLTVGMLLGPVLGAARSGLSDYAKKRDSKSGNEDGGN